MWENAPFITEEGEPYLVGKSIYYEELMIHIYLQFVLIAMTNYLF